MQIDAINSIVFQDPDEVTQIKNKNAVNNFSNLVEKATKEANSLQSSERLSYKKKATIDKTSKLYEQCQELESCIMKILVDGMRKTVMKSPLVDESYASKMYEDMLYDSYAENLAKNNSFGLADQAYLELTGQRGVILS